MRVTRERLIELLDYDFDTGLFTHKATRPGVRGGRVAGSASGNGHIKIIVDGRHCHAHNLAWLVVTGEWPIGELDHRNGVKSDNSWGNLRDGTHAENMQNKAKYRNNTTGYTGVTFHKATGRFAASIRLNGKTNHLGLFDDPAEAGAAYLKGKGGAAQVQPRPEALMTLNPGC